MRTRIVRSVVQRRQRFESLDSNPGVMQTNGYDRQAALMHDDVGGATGLAYGLTPEAQKGSAVPSAPKRRLVCFVHRSCFLSVGGVYLYLLLLSTPRVK